MSEAYDYSQDVVPEAGDNILARLANLAQQAREAASEVANRQAALQASQERLRDITQRQLPELMDEAGQRDCVASDGTRLVVSETVRASITEERRLPAFTWLRENGHAGIIKNEVKAQFGRNEGDQAAAAVQALEAMGAHPEQKLAVAPNTLAKLIGELLRDGIDVPLDTFGAFIQREVKLK